MKLAVYIIIMFVVSGCVSAAQPAALPRFGDNPAYMAIWLEFAPVLGVPPECELAPAGSPLRQVSTDAEREALLQDVPDEYGFVAGKARSQTNEIVILLAGEYHVSTGVWHRTIGDELITAAHEAAHIALWCMGVEGGDEHHQRIHDAGIISRPVETR